MTRRTLEGEERAKHLRKILESPIVARKIRQSMLATFSNWAAGSEEAVAEIDQLVKEMKIVVSAQLQAKPGRDPRVALLALDAVCLDFARAIVMEDAEVEEEKTEAGEVVETVETVGGVH